MNKENKTDNENLNRLLKQLSCHDVNGVPKTINEQSSFNINQKPSFILDSDSDEFYSCRSSWGLDSGLLTITSFYLTKLDEIVNNISLDENYSKDIDEINIKNKKKRGTFLYHIFKIFPFYKKKFSKKAFNLILYFKLAPSMGDLLISYLNLCTDIFNDPNPNNWKSSLCFNDQFASEEDLGMITEIDKKIKNIRENYNDIGLDRLNKEEHYSPKKNFNVTNDLLFPPFYKKQ